MSASQLAANKSANADPGRPPARGRSFGIRPQVSTPRLQIVQRHVGILENLSSEADA